MASAKTARPSSTSSSSTNGTPMNATAIPSSPASAPTPVVAAPVNDAIPANDASSSGGAAPALPVAAGNSIISEVSQAVTKAKGRLDEINALRASAVSKADEQKQKIQLEADEYMKKLLEEEEALRKELLSIGVNLGGTSAVTKPAVKPAKPAKASKVAKPSSDSSDKPTSKADAVRAALKEGVEKPQEAVEWIKSNFGIDISAGMFSNYKSTLGKTTAKKPRASKPQAPTKKPQASKPQGRRGARNGVPAGDMIVGYVNDNYQTGDKEGVQLKDIRKYLRSEGKGSNPSMECDRLVEKGYIKRLASKGYAPGRAQK